MSIWCQTCPVSQVNHCEKLMQADRMTQGYSHYEPSAIICLIIIWKFFAEPKLRAYNGSCAFQAFLCHPTDLTPSCFSAHHHSASPRRYRESWEQHPPLPLSEKKDAVAFVNSNCEAPSGRNQIVASLRAQPGVKVDALGRCLSGGGAILNGPEAKHEAFRGSVVNLLN